jgi:1-acyl-sn-glycerol-3-phosphate acyltransferase
MTLRPVYTFVGYYLTLGMFGAGGLMLSLVAMLAGILPTTERTERFFQRLIHRHFAVFVWWTAFARLFHVRYHGLEELGQDHRGLVIVANHPSLTDITSLLARVPEAVCIFKPTIRRNPVLGAAARQAGYLASDGGHDVIRHAAEKVAAGHTVIIFPEGTRTPPGNGLLPFKPGFVLMARRAGVPIQLVRIVCSRPVLAKGRAWWKLPPLPACSDLTIGPRRHVTAGANTAAAAAEIEAWFRATPEAAACHPWSPAFSCAA